jgi:hypothetical protein
MYGSNLGLEFEVVIDDNIHPIKGEKVSAYMHTALWIKTFYSCLITRAHNGIEELSKTPNSVFENANIKPNAFDLAYVDLLKGLFDSNANIGDLLNNAIDTSAPNLLESERADYILHLTSPIITLIYHMLKNDPEAFNQELESALEAHKNFWSQNGNQDDSYGWISLPLTAICSLAVDNKEFNITVESEYLPSWLYKKEF